MSVITKSAFDSSKFKHKIKSAGQPLSSKPARGPVKASYEIPNKQWQMKYTYNSQPSSKNVQNGFSHKSGKKSGKVAEESSEYGTMENPDNNGVMPLLNIEDNSCFNDVTIEERRERIGAIMDEILSIPRLAEANITKRSLSRSSMTRFTGGGSVSRAGSSQMMNNGSSRASNFSRFSSSQDRRSVLVRSVSSPKITTTASSSKPVKNTDNKRKEVNSNLNRRSTMMSRSTSNVGKSNQKKTSSEVPKLNLGLDVTSRSQLPGYGGQRPSRLEEDELSAEFLPSHNTSNLRPELGNVTQAELAISVPTLGDDTLVVNDESDTFEMEKSTDFVRANMKISPKKIPNSGRASAASSIVTAKHRAGAVPK